ncbi:MAG TPA: SMP-30/gluconolactonase/LRE family protein [Kofleriaceae bacterium]|nr:SMP-30/gluconolactonase/LRE family protein [Kofleriaceae bacterium]
MQLRSIVAISLCAAACGGGNAGPPDASSPDAYKAPPFTAGVSTLAGAPDYGFVDGDRDTARFWNPVNVIVGPDDKIYVADFDNGAIRRSDKDGNVETVYKDSKFMRPFGLVFDASGALYVSTDNDDTGAHTLLSGTIWKIDTTAKTAEVVVRGIGRARGLAMLPDGKIVMTDFLHQTIRTLDPTTKAITIIAGAEDVPGFADATGADARFDAPYGVVVVSGPSLVVADWGNQRLRAVALDGTTSTIAGDGTAAWLDGAALSARFDHPQGLAVAADGTIYVSDMDTFRVRRLANGMVDTIAGNGTGGYMDADDRLAAELYGLEGLGLSADGKKLYVADGDRGEDIEPYHRVRVVTITP